MLVIVDYGIGNIASVQKAIEHLGGKVKVSSSVEDIKNADSLILPGVSEFSATIKELKKRKLLSLIKDHINQGKKYLGICLGMQVLTQASEESKGVSGLSILEGEVKRFSDKKNLTVPQMGWNQVHYKENNKIAKLLFKGIKQDSFFYFAHSYFVKLKEKNAIRGRTSYGVKYVSLIVKDNIVACQFHPEKSQKNGLMFLENWINL